MISKQNVLSFFRENAKTYLQVIQIADKYIFATMIHNSNNNHLHKKASCRKDKNMSMKPVYMTDKNSDF